MTLFWAALAWLAGIAAGKVVRQPAFAWLLLTGLAVGLAVIFWRDSRVRLPLICAVLFGLGGARFQWSLPTYDERFVASYNGLGETVTVEGVVVDEPDVRDKHINLRLRADSLLLPDSESALAVTGLVLVRAPRFPVYGYGDRLRVFGQLETPSDFEDFPFGDYLARQGVYSVMPFASATFIAPHQANPLKERLFDFKSRALHVLEVIFPQPHAALMQGILLGIESGIPDDLEEAFRATGTSHIIVISGFNFTILAALFALIANRLFGPRRGLWLSVAGIAIYALLVGAAPAVVRAAIMGGLALFARRVGRRAGGLNVLMVTALVMTMFNPLILWDVGFQLSFMATLGLVLYAEPLTDAFVRLISRVTTREHTQRLAGPAGDTLLPGRTVTLYDQSVERMVGPVGDAFLLTIAAQITTLPLIVYYFQRVSLVSLLANFLILPAQPAVMILSGLALLGGLVWLPLGRVLGWIAYPFVAYTISIVELLAKVSWASLNLWRPSWSLVWLAYAALFGLTWQVQRKEKPHPDNARFLTPARAGLMALVGLGIASVLAWQMAFRLPDGRLHLTVLDVGEGDAVFIETPTGRRVLIGGGESTSTLSSALGRRLPFFDRRLDWVVLGASEQEHIGGLAGIIGPVQIGNVLAAGKPARTGVYRNLMETLNESGTPVQAAETGQSLDLGEGAKLEVLSAENAGGVFRVNWRRASFLLPIGLDGPTLERMLAEGRLAPSSGLLLVQGGDVALNSEELLAAVNPGLAVISRAGDEPLSMSLMDRLEGLTVLRTDLNGWVEWATDGESAWVTAER